MGGQGKGGRETLCLGVGVEVLTELGQDSQPELAWDPHLLAAVSPVILTVTPCRLQKLWICMEFCGAGSLQDIYQG